MARRSSSSRSTGGRSRSISTSRAPSPRLASASPPAAPMPAAPPAQHTSGGGGFLGNIAGAVTSGIGHGVGFSLASRAVDAVIGPRRMEVTHTNEPAAPTISQTQPEPANPWNTPSRQEGWDRNQQCELQMEDLKQCMSRFSDLNSCQRYFDALKACQQTA